MSAPTNRIAMIYARAFYETVHKSGNGQSKGGANWAKYVDQTGSVVAAIEKSKEARVALYSPATSSKEKLALIEALAKKYKFAEPVVGFLSLLAQKGRMNFLGQIHRSFDRIRLEAQGGILGEVASPDKLSDSDVQSLSKAFAQKMGHPVEFVSKTDEDLLAGLKVTVAGVTYDGSLRAQLNRVKEIFAGDGQSGHA